MMATNKMKLDESKFIKVETTSESQDPVNHIRYGDNRRIDKGVPVACDCGLPVVVGTLNSSEGREERHFMCGYDLSDGLREGCGFKRAVEKALIDEVAVIKGNKAELQLTVDEAMKKMGEDRGTLVWMQVQYEDMMAHRKNLEDYEGEIGDTQLGLAQLADKHNSLERKVVSLQKTLDTEKMMLRRYGEVRATDKGVPIGCDCGQAFIVETDKEPSKRGKKYFACPYGAVDGCGFKRWCVDAIMEEFELIKQDRETMSKTLEETTDKNEEMQQRVQAGEDDGTTNRYIMNIRRKLGQITEQVNELARKYEWLEKEFLKIGIYI